jgi:hypothetical protein
MSKCKILLTTFLLLRKSGKNNPLVRNFFKGFYHTPPFNALNKKKDLNKKLTKSYMLLKWKKVIFSGTNMPFMCD